MYKWSPYYRRYCRSKRSPYYKWSSLYNKWSPYRYNTFGCSPLYKDYRWSPHYYRYLTDRYYSYRWTPYYRRYYFDDLYLDLKNKMDLFKNFLDSIPKHRSEVVNDLEIPKDVLKNRPYADEVVDLDDEDLSSIGNASSVYSIEELKPRARSPLSTDSSISLSKAMTCSEIDYDLCRRIKNRRRSEPFHEMEAVLQAFPEEYLVSLKNFQKPASEIEPARTQERPLYNEDLIHKMRSLYEECRPFSPDDPALAELEEALQAVDLKSLDLDLI